MNAKFPKNKIVKYLLIALLIFHWAYGCNSIQELNGKNNVSNKAETIISQEDELINNYGEDENKSLENELKKEDEELKLKEEEEIKLLIDHYRTYIKNDNENEIKSLSFIQAKKTIDEIVQRASTWDYYKPGDYYPKGQCSIIAKNAADFEGTMTPLIHLYRDNLLNPSILVIPGVLASGKPTVQVQLGDATAQNVNYTNESGLILRLNEAQYKDIVNNAQDMKIHIIKDSGTITIHIASGNIKKCADRIEHRKLNNWEYKEEIDAFDESTYRFCASVSPNKVYANLNFAFDEDNKENPVLVIRQKNHHMPEIMLSSRGIRWPSYWNHKIRIKFNDEKPISNSYTMGAGSITIIFLNSEKQLLQRLFTAKRVTFQMPDSKETFSYDLSELSETCAGLDLSGIVK